MISYVVRRLAYAVITFFGITVGTFALIHLVPGDPISFYIGTRRIPPSIIAAVRHEHHLDQALPVQYGYWLRSIVSLDMGRSIIDHRSVLETIRQKVPNTFALNLIAFIVAVLIGVPAGLWSATRSGTATEQTTAAGFYLLYSLPSFWVALLLMQWLSVRVQVLPLFGMTSDDYSTMNLAQQLSDRLRHCLLPVITLSYAQIAIFARFSKSAVTEVIRQDFITTARAKGVSGFSVLWHHAFRNALIPLITLLGLTIPFLISGSVIVERIFQWDGIGLLYYNAILSRDYPVVLALTVATSVLTLLVSLCADLLYAVVDPRVRLGA